MAKKRYRYKKYAEGGGVGGSMNLRGSMDQLKKEVTPTRNVGTFIEDVGKWTINSTLTPLETITGRNFYDPEFSYGEMNKIDAVTSGGASAATDILGTYFGGPFYTMGKKATRAAVNKIDADGSWDNTNSQVAKHGGHVKKYFDGGNVDLSSLTAMFGNQSGGDDAFTSMLSSMMTNGDNQSGAGNLLENLAGKMGGGDNFSNIMGQYGDSSTRINPKKFKGDKGSSRDWIGFDGGLIDTWTTATPQQLKKEEEIKENISTQKDISRKDGGMRVFSSDGAGQFGISDYGNPMQNAFLNDAISKQGIGAGTFDKIGTTIAKVGELASNYVGGGGSPGGDGSAMFSQFGGGSGGGFDISNLGKYLGMNAPGSMRDGGKVTNTMKRKYEDGAEVKAEASNDPNLQTDLNDTLQVPEGYEGYFEVDHGASHEEGGSNINLPAEGQGNTTIEAEKGEGVSVENGESFVWSLNKKPGTGKSFKARKDAREATAAKIKDELEKSGKNIDPYRKNTLMRTLMNLQVEDDADRKEQEDIKSKKELEERIALEGLLSGTTAISEDGSYRQGGKVKKLSSYQKSIYDDVILNLPMSRETYDNGGPVDKRDSWNGRSPADWIGEAGLMYGAQAGMANTEENWRKTDPNENFYKNTGKRAEDRLKNNLGVIEAGRDRTTGKLQEAFNKKTALNRNASTSFSNLDARNRADYSTLQDSVLDTNVKYDMMDLKHQGVIANQELESDKLRDTGEYKRDLADRKDLDNYYTQRGKDIQNVAKNMMEFSKNKNKEFTNKQLFNTLNTSGGDFETDELGNIIPRRKHGDGGSVRLDEYFGKILKDNRERNDKITEDRINDFRNFMKNRK